MKIKNIIILYKKSAYAIYFLRRKKAFSRFVRIKELDRFKRTHETHYRSLDKVQKILKSSKVFYKISSRGRGIDYSPYDLVITVGGDGTFLEAARGLKRQMILGVNSDPQWSVGRFCCARADNFEAMIKKVLGGRMKLKKFPRIRVKTDAQQRPVNVLNDILICHKNPAALSRYCLTINGKTEEQKSSGIWIATAAGSSGAIKSAGGKLLPPESRKVQYQPRELYKGNGNHYRLTGGVLTLIQPIKLTSLMREGVVYMDGSHVSFPFDFGHTVLIEESPEPLNVVCG